jgi:hypothetical protein
VKEQERKNNNAKLKKMASNAITDMTLKNKI